MPVLSTDIKFYKTKSSAAKDGEATGDNLGGYRSSDEITTNVAGNVLDNVSSDESEVGDIEYGCIGVKNTSAQTLFAAKVWITGNVPECALTTQLENGGSETTVAVDNQSTFPTTGTFFIEDEEIAYTGKSSTTSFTGCTRGHNSTSKALHLVTTKCCHNRVHIAIEAPSNLSNGYVQHINTSGDAPIGLVWYDVRTRATGRTIGDLLAGQWYAIWYRRKIPMGCQAKSNITDTIRVEGETEE